MTRSRQHFAFTLWELILVMVIITFALAMAAPSLAGWGRGQKLRDVSDQFLAVTRWARSQAISDAQIYRLNIDSAAGAYWLTAQQGEQFVELGNSFGQVHTLPEGYSLAIVADDVGAPQSQQTIDFMPNGRVTPARIQITTDLGAVTQIAALTPTEPFALIDTAEVRP